MAMRARGRTAWRKATAPWLPAWLLLVLVLPAPIVHAVQPQPQSGPAPAERAQAAVPRVVVSIAPLKGLVEPLLPPGTRVVMLVPPGVSEHGYEIPPAGLAELARADLVVYVGMGLEPQVEKFLATHARSGRRVVEFADLSSAPAASPAGTPTPTIDHTAHRHDESGACIHPEGDPHLWLDPVQAGGLVERVAAELQAWGESRGLSLAERAAIAERAKALLQRLDALHLSYSARLAKTLRKRIVVTHDAFGLLATRYGFQTVALKGLNAGEPTPKALEAAAKAVRAEGIPVVFVEPQLSKAAGERLAAALGVPTRTLDPLGTGDYFDFMLKNLDALALALGVEGEQPPADSAPPVTPKGR